MERINTGTIQLTWDFPSRLAELRFESETYLMGKDAAVLADALKLWIGKDGRPFGMLVDGARLSGVDAEFRSVGAAFFRAHREDSCVAAFNMSPILRVIVDMFRVGTGMRLKAFASESAARAWLQKMGIPA
jgi:hypothetical protein